MAKKCTADVGKLLYVVFNIIVCYSDVLQVLRDVPKARREIMLHCKASMCRHIVSIIDVYENIFGGNKCLLVVMEW